jgi:hypothetical protein
MLKAFQASSSRPQDALIFQDLKPSIPQDASRHAKPLKPQDASRTQDSSRLQGQDSIYFKAAQGLKLKTRFKKVQVTQDLKSQDFKLQDASHTTRPQLMPQG